MAASNTKNLNDKIKKSVIDNNKTVAKKLAKASKKPKKRGPKKADPMVKFLPVLERYLILGYSLSKACQLGGLPWSTVQEHYADNAKFRQSVDGLTHAPNVKARANIVSSINRGSVEDSWKWLNSREREDFATRTENTGKDGEPLTQPVEVVFVSPDKKK